MRGPKRHAEAPHEVSDHHCGGPADPLLAVHQDAASIHDGLVHPLQGPVEQQGDILLVAVLQVICDVAEVLREAALTEIGSHVHDVGDPVPSEALQVGSNLVTGDVESVRENLGARRPVAIQPQVLEKMVGQMVIVLLVVRVVGVDKLLLGHVDLLQVQHRRRIGTLRDRWARGAHCRRFQGKRRQGALLPLRLGLGGASRLGGPWGCGFASAGSAQSTQAQARHHRAAPCRCGTDALCLRSAQRPQAQARHHRCRARPRPLHALGELCRTSFEIEAPGLGRTALSGELIRRGDCRFLLFLLLVHGAPGSLDALCRGGCLLGPRQVCLTGSLRGRQSEARRKARPPAADGLGIGAGAHWPRPQVGLWREVKAEVLPGLALDKMQDFLCCDLDLGPCLLLAGVAVDDEQGQGAAKAADVEEQWRGKLEDPVLELNRLGAKLRTALCAQAHVGVAAAGQVRHLDLADLDGTEADTRAA
mmetsp:Transcript_102004/g.227860  ORF Transcript_102004/g.227860 Transcript_102004/m.227860 type:complete len:476 (-) Transcript_102004:947-2374(-)